MAKRTCKAQRSDGGRCRAAPLVGSDFCSVHDPANADAMAEARRLGGQRRKREATLAGVYDFSGLTTISDIKRIVEIALFDTLGLENGVARNRTLLAGAQTALRVVEVGGLADRMEKLEAAVREPKDRAESAFDHPDDTAFPSDEGAA